MIFLCFSCFPLYKLPWISPFSSSQFGKPRVQSILGKLSADSWYPYSWMTIPYFVLMCIKIEKSINIRRGLRTQSGSSILDLDREYTDSKLTEWRMILHNQSGISSVLNLDHEYTDGKLTDWRTMLHAQPGISSILNLDREYTDGKLMDWRTMLHAQSGISSLHDLVREYTDDKLMDWRTILHHQSPRECFRDDTWNDGLLQRKSCYWNNNSFGYKKTCWKEMMDWKMATKRGSLHAFELI